MSSCSLVAFTLFAVWRLHRRKFDRIVEEREEFLAYPQTSPEIYAWLPYHRESPVAAPAADPSAGAATTPAAAGTDPASATDSDSAPAAAGGSA